MYRWFGVASLAGTLRKYVELAYGSWDGGKPKWPRPEIQGGPNWMDTDPYDINAKAEGVTPY